MTYEEKVEYERLIYKAKYRKLDKEVKARLNYLSKLKIEALKNGGLPLFPVPAHWDIPELVKLRNDD